LLAENADTEYVAYVSEQNLLPDRTGEPLRNPKVAEMFVQDKNGRFYPVFIQAH
jgi:heat shock protein HspQ